MASALQRKSPPEALPYLSVRATSTCWEQAKLSTVLAQQQTLAVSFSPLYSSSLCVHKVPLGQTLAHLAAQRVTDHSGLHRRASETFPL